MHSAKSEDQLVGTIGSEKRIKYITQDFCNSQVELWFGKKHESNQIVRAGLNRAQVGERMFNLQINKRKNNISTLIKEIDCLFDNE